MDCVGKCCLIINVFVLCIGLIVMGTAAAAIHQQNKFDVVLTNAHTAVTLQTLLSGIFLALRGCLCCVGVLKEKPYMLTAYWVVVWLVLVGVVTTAITLLKFTDKARNFLNDSMADVYQQYGEEGKQELTHALDVLQREGQCCGINGYKDWANFPYRNGTSVADGCCQKWAVGCGVGMLNNPNVAELVWSGSCLDYVYGVFVVTCIALAIFSFIHVGFQTLSFVSGCISGASGGYHGI